MTMTTLTPVQNPAPARAPRGAGLSRGLLVEALPGTLRKLDPRLMWRNPVMFVVEVGAVLSSAIAIAEPFLGDATTATGRLAPSFSAGIAIWLWLTVLFANLAEAVAEGRGKAQAQSLRATRTSTLARRVSGYDEKSDPDALRATLADVASADLKLGDTVVVTAGEVIPGDGDI